MMALAFAPAQIQRICVGKQEVRLDQVLCLEIVELHQVTEYGGIHLKQLRWRAILCDVADSDDATLSLSLSLSVDEIPIMAGTWVCLHDSAFTS
jgi:hypothetical protein